MRFGVCREILECSKAGGVDNTTMYSLPCFRLAERYSIPWITALEPPARRQVTRLGKFCRRSAHNSAFTAHSNLSASSTKSCAMPSNGLTCC